MPQRTSNNNNVLLVLAACLAVGCSKGDRLGCGSSTESASSTSGESGSKVASSLVGVYKVTHYQQSQDTCDQLVDITEAPSHLVLYHFEPSDGSGTRLGGAFCGDPSLCRALAAKAVAPTVGYSFISGDDASGWQGWAIVGSGPVEKQCGAAVQSHVLTSGAERAIRIETKTVQTVFAPLVDEEEGVATCKNRDAIVAAKADLPCEALLVLEGSREGGP